MLSWTNHNDYQCFIQCGILLFIQRSRISERCRRSRRLIQSILNYATFIRTTITRLTLEQKSSWISKKGQQHRPLVLFEIIPSLHRHSTNPYLIVLSPVIQYSRRKRTIQSSPSFYSLSLCSMNLQ